MIHGYQMGYGAPLDPHRVEAFFDKKLDDQDLVVFAQDVLEAGEYRLRGPDVYKLVMHMVESNLCTIPGRSQ